MQPSWNWSQRTRRCYYWTLILNKKISFSRWYDKAALSLLPSVNITFFPLFWKTVAIAKWPPYLRHSIQCSLYSQLWAQPCIQDYILLMEELKLIRKTGSAELTMGFFLRSSCFNQYFTQRWPYLRLQRNGMRTKWWNGDGVYFSLVGVTQGIQAGSCCSSDRVVVLKAVFHWNLIPDFVRRFNSIQTHDIRWNSNQAYVHIRDSCED